MVKFKRNWPVFIRGLVHVRWERGLPRLVIHEQYQQLIKWTLRILWLIGVVSSVATLGPVGGIALGLLLTVIQQFLERAVFRYTTIVLTPLPDFSFSMDEITAMAFAYPAEADPHLLPAVGFAFARKDLAEKFFAVLKRWNYGKREDTENNIRLTFVWPKKGKGYYVCLYPNLRRKGVEDTFASIGAAMAEEEPGKEQHGLIVVWMIRKHLRGGDNAKLRIFAERQLPDAPFWLQAFLSVDGVTKVELLTDIEPILKMHYRVVNERDLRKTDPEYRMMQW